MTKLLDKYRHILTNPYVILTFIVFVVVAYIRFRLINIPLERDEGEYAYAGQLIIKGSLPYTEMYNMKMPGIYFVYSFILLFGQTIFTIHLALFFANLISAYFIYRITTELYNNINAGFVSVISFLTISISPMVQGLQANSEHFVLLFMLPSILLLILANKTQNTRYYFFTGLLSSLAFLTKQHAFGFILFIIVYTIVSNLYLNKVKFYILFKSLVFIAIGGIIPVAIITSIYFFTGNFEKFWFFTIEYAQEYIGYSNMLKGPYYFIESVYYIFMENKILWLLPVISIVLVFKNKLKQKYSIFILLFFFFSYLAISPGNYFRPHYFILFVPIVSISTGYLVKLINIKNKMLSIGFVIVILLGFTEAIHKRYNLFFEYNNAKAIRTVYNYSNPFEEAVHLSKYLKENNNKGDYLTIIGAEPEVFFYSQLKSTTGYIYFYPLYEDHPFANKMIDEMISEVESKQPKHLIFLRYINYMWGKPENRYRVKNWSKNYIAKNYNYTGYIAIYEDAASIYSYNDTIASEIYEEDIFYKIYTRKN